MWQLQQFYKILNSFLFRNTIKKQTRKTVDNFNSFRNSTTLQKNLVLLPLKGVPLLLIDGLHFSLSSFCRLWSVFWKFFLVFFPFWRSCCCFYSAKLASQAKRTIHPTNQPTEETEENSGFTTLWCLVCLADVIVVVFIFVCLFCFFLLFCRHRHVTGGEQRVENVFLLVANLCAFSGPKRKTRKPQ